MHCLQLPLALPEWSEEMSTEGVKRTQVGYSQNFRAMDLGILLSQIDR
jgi:hypothetical protein